MRAPKTAAKATVNLMLAALALILLGGIAAAYFLYSFL
jgi:LPXTG-motif cell wall-anchored protein